MTTNRSRGIERVACEIKLCTGHYTWHRNTVAIHLYRIIDFFHHVQYKREGMSKKIDQKNSNTLFGVFNE